MRLAFAVVLRTACVVGLCSSSNKSGVSQLHLCVCVLLLTITERKSYAALREGRPIPIPNCTHPHPIPSSCIPTQPSLAKPKHSEAQLKEPSCLHLPHTVRTQFSSYSRELASHHQKRDDINLSVTALRLSYRQRPHCPPLDLQSENGEVLEQVLASSCPAQHQHPAPSSIKRTERGTLVPANTSSAAA